MRITPLDIRKQEFRRVVRGLDAEEVHAFMTTVADEYEAVLVDNKQLRERILEQDDKMGEYRNMEKTLRDTLMTAERVLDEAKEGARKEAQLILQDAEMRAHQVTENLRRQATELRREVVELHKEKDSYLARFKGLAEAQIQFIDNHQTDFDELDRRLMNWADSINRQTEPVTSEQDEERSEFRAERTTRSGYQPSPPSPPQSRREFAEPQQRQQASEPRRRPEHGETWRHQEFSEPQPERASDIRTEPTPVFRHDTDSDQDVWRHYTPGSAQAGRRRPAGATDETPREVARPLVEEPAAPRDRFDEERASAPADESAFEPPADLPDIDSDEDRLLESEEVDQLLKPIRNGQESSGQAEPEPRESEAALVAETVVREGHRDQEKTRSWDMDSFSRGLGKM
jgi:cell division initiation protein